ncbi:hypothetical protein Mal64_08710 [Pseudobythopirellula maris]|uniref:Phytase-like domain-containing protein n=1 Tax=Pseudobythopirellula maris TaxID=2527991 RepID=A0A5C5ZUA8_9BACT|nr:esterase-like activity of phytase family protein [Pseudobythopirellula maris]TWT90481.1 hypothetical protein Mal64_08710 [Pseudobythopirellula maris]
MIRSIRTAVAVGVLLLAATPAHATTWSIVDRGAVVLDTNLVPNVAEMSGVTYLGVEGNLLRFAAVQDSGGRVVNFDVSATAGGTINAATAVSSVTLANSLDFEGVAALGDGLALFSEETTPGVRAYDLSSGAAAGVVDMPAVYSHRRSNKGLESLALSRDGHTLWTGNEEALTIDGPLASGSAGTTVRLQRFAGGGVDWAAAEQYAYQVEPIHAIGFGATPRRGLSDLMALPDGSLLTLERSFAGLASPVYVSGMFLVDFEGATDISDAVYDSGLTGEIYTPVGKTSLYSKPAGSSVGQNLEGITLGPRLANGSWLVMGVVDDSGGDDPVSDNTVIAFELAPPKPSLPGDYDGDGEVDLADLAAWRGSFGLTMPAGNEHGGAGADGNANGVVDAADFTVWRDNYAPPAATTVPEPAGVVVVLLAAISVATTWRGASR